MDKPNIGPIPVEYYCPGCRHKVTRLVGRRTRVYESFCNTAGRGVKMKLLKKYWYARETEVKS